MQEDPIPIKKVFIDKEVEKRINISEHQKFHEEIKRRNKK